MLVMDYVSEPRVVESLDMCLLKVGEGTKNSNERCLFWSPHLSYTGLPCLVHAH